MSEYLDLEGVSDAFAGLTVAGLTIGAVDALRESYTVRDCPILTPAPSFVTGLQIIRESYGSSMQARKTCNYTLTYRLLYTPVGSTRGLLDIYLPAHNMLDAIVSAVMDNDYLSGGVIDIVASAVTPLSVVTDPAGNSFFGCDISFACVTFAR